MSQYADPRIIPNPSYAYLKAELNNAQGLVQDMTAIIAARCAQDLALSEQIAHAIGDTLDTDPADMDLPELVQALIDYARDQHVRAEAMAIEPDPTPAPPATFFVLNFDGRITGRAHNSDSDARAWAANNGAGAFTIVRVVASCTTRVATEWKEY